MKQLDALYRLARRDHVTVDCFPLPQNASLSLLDEKGNCHIAIDPSMVESSADEKVTLAHELGHCETGAFYNRWSPWDIRQKHENRADRWAYRQLLPRRRLKAAARQGITQAWELAEYFDLPEAFVRAALDYYRQQEEGKAAGFG